MISPMVINLLEVSALDSKGLWSFIKIPPCGFNVVIILVGFIVCNTENIRKPEIYPNDFDSSDVTIIYRQYRQNRQWKFWINRANINDEVNDTLNTYIYFQEVHNAVLRR